MTQVTENSTKAWFVAIAAWLIPGLGHVWVGHVKKGILVGATVFVMFIVGGALGGHLYSLFDPSEGVLSSVFALCDLGAGFLYGGSMALGVATKEQAELATAEYGNVFLMAAGLLNYLITLDAFDTAVGRKP